MKLLHWTDLTGPQQAQVRRAFTNWHLDTTVRTFEQWAEKHAFWMKNDGQLAHRRYAEPECMVAEVEQRQKSRLSAGDNRHG